MTTVRPAPADTRSTYHRLVRLKRLLPEWLRYRLDPYNTVADRFIASAAASLPDGTIVLDAGAGECRHRPLFAHTRYLGTDSGAGEAGVWDYSQLTFLSDLTALPLLDGAADVVVSVNVLEHVRDPAAVLRECNRALRPGGRIFLVAPQAWQLHQAPEDYLRFTRYGLELLLERAGFRVEDLRPVGGTFWNVGYRSLYLLTHFKGAAFPLLFLLAPFLAVLFPLACFYLDRLDREKDDTLGHCAIASKRGDA